MRIIDELWYGNLLPAERIGLHDMQIRKLLALIVKNKEELEGKLQEEQREALRAFADNYDQYVYLLEKAAFREGFCLATKLFGEAILQK